LRTYRFYTYKEICKSKTPYRFKGRYRIDPVEQEASKSSKNVLGSSPSPMKKVLSLTRIYIYCYYLYIVIIIESSAPSYETNHSGCKCVADITKDNTPSKDYTERSKRMGDTPNIIVAVL
jgi:hypothetical protein